MGVWLQGWENDLIIFQERKSLITWENDFFTP